MRFDKYSVINLFIFYPLGAIPFLVKDMKRLKRYAFFLLAVFMGLLGFLIVPLDNDDLASHYETFEFIAEGNWSDLILFLRENVDFVLYLVMYLISSLHLPKELLPFLSVFLGYYIKFMIFYRFMKFHAKVELTTSEYFGIFLMICFFSTPFRNFALHIRNFVAVAVICYGVYLIFIEDDKKGWIYVILAPFIHFMVILIIPLIIISRFFKISRILRFVFIVSFVFMMLPTSYVTNYITSINYSNEKFEQKQRVYGEGYYVGDYLDDISFKGRVAGIIGLFPIFFIFTYLVIFKTESCLRNLTYLTAILCNFFYSTPMIYGRYTYILVSFFFLLLLYEFNCNNIGSSRKYFLKYFMIVTFIVFLSGLYSTKAQIIKGDIKIFYNSLPTVFLYSVDKNDYIK
jgi:hypothetical protein